MRFECLAPMEIEARSMRMIENEMATTPLPENMAVLKRVIHTTADFEYERNLLFSAGAVPRAVEALHNGCDVVTDTNMTKAGVNKRVLAALGGEVHCFMADEDVAAQAKESGETRAAIAMQKVALLGKPCIISVGNAPTALVKLYDLIQQGAIDPVLVIGVPVGFVNVVEAKELIMTAGVPYIVARGRKGGSNVAAAILNAMLYEIQRDT